MNGGTVFDIQPLVSAAQAIEALIHVELLLGFAGGAHLTRRDGYDRKEDFIGDLCLRLEAEFNERIEQPNPSVKRG